MKGKKTVKKSKRQIFHCSIWASNRKAIIKELKWLVYQVELDADGGGTDNSKIQSNWSLDIGVHE